MSVTAYPTLRLKLTMPQALKLQFLPAVPGSNAAVAADRAEQAAQDAQNAANTAVAATANKVDRSGDVMSGFLTLNADPTALLHAATKQYVDAHSGGGGGGGAPVGAEYITSTADATLTAERVLTDTATITWDRTTAGQIKANTAAGGGNISNSGTPALDQVGVWVTSTTIKGIGGTANQVLRIGGAGTTPTFGAVDLSQTAAVTGILRTASFPALTGDVTTSSGAVATTITTDAVTYAKMQNVSAASLLIGRGSAAGAGDPQEITLGTNLAMSGTTLNATASGGTATAVPPQGRLTLTAGTPVMTSTVSGATTIRYTPYCGNQIGLYDGANVVMSTFTELSNLTAQSSTGNAGPAAVAASSVYDLFVWSNAGVPTLTRGPAWSSDTVRSAGTALVMVNGLWLNNAAITNGPAASRGTYVGTVRSNASSTIDWIFGSIGTGGAQAAFFNVWNCYNRVNVTTIVTESTGSWAYANATPRAVNNSTGNRISFVSGLAEDGSIFDYSIQASLGASGTCYIGLGLDSTSIWDHSSLVQMSPSVTVIVSQSFGPQVGFHFVQAMEAGDGSVTTTFYMVGNPYRGGFNGQFRM